MIRLITLLFAISVTGCTSKQNQPTLDYKVNNKIFHLPQSCIENFSQKKENQTIFIKVKGNVNCSFPFNDFFKDNVGKTVTVLFNGDVVYDGANIINPIKTENGFYQAVEKKSTFDKLINDFR